MSLKENNEITLKIKCELNEFYEIMKKKGFKVIDKFRLDDTYFIPKDLKLNKTNIRYILSKAVLVRDITDKLNQESVNCKIYDIEDAKKLLKAIGYKEIMNIIEDDVVYEKEGFEIAVKDIKNGDKLIEIETTDNEELDTIEKLIKKVNELEIPIYTDNYFVKKAEVELEKIIPHD